MVQGAHCRISQGEKGWSPHRFWFIKLRGCRLFLHRALIKFPSSKNVQINCNVYFKSNLIIGTTMYNTFSLKMQHATEIYLATLSYWTENMNNNQMFCENWKWPKTCSMNVVLHSSIRPVCLLSSSVILVQQKLWN